MIGGDYISIGAEYELKFFLLKIYNGIGVTRLGYSREEHEQYLKRLEKRKYLSIRS
jgi:hypothetical protein